MLAMIKESRFTMELSYQERGKRTIHMKAWDCYPVFVSWSLVRKRAFMVGGIALICAFFLWFGTILPRTTTEVFASPDETAVSLFAKAWNETGVFRILHGLPEAASGLIGLHPRSMVRQGEWLVPVGFLGMPFLAAVIDRIHDGWSEFFTAFLVLFSAIPLWFLVHRSFRSRIAWWSVLVYLSFPTVLLYVNRGFFPNLPVVACTLWGVWLLRKAIEAKKGVWMVVCAGLSGFAIGLALFIRPIEVIWIAPWVIWFSIDAIRYYEKTRLHWMWVCVIAFVIFLGVGGYGMLLSKQTYPYHSAWNADPVAGYVLRDRDHAAEDRSEVKEISDSAVSSRRSISSLLPIGFHPRTMWQNVRVFLFGLFGIWFGMAVFGFVLVQRRYGWRKISIVSGLMIWTTGILLLTYGQTSYMDNINGTATLGNSFLRYLLPLVPLIAIGCAIVIDRLHDFGGRKGLFLSLTLGCFLVFFGISSAYARDDESLASTRRELTRYASIRHQAEWTIPPGSVILSERSDKIFAGLFTSVSPLPDKETVTKLHQANVPILIFHRIPTKDDEIPESLRDVYPLAQWMMVFRADREALFYLAPIPLDPL